MKLVARLRTTAAGGRPWASSGPPGGSTECDHCRASFSAIMPRTVTSTLTRARFRQLQLAARRLTAAASGHPWTSSGPWGGSTECDHCLASVRLSCLAPWQQLQDLHASTSFNLTHADSPLLQAVVLGRLLVVRVAVQHVVANQLDVKYFEVYAYRRP